MKMPEPSPELLAQLQGLLLPKTQLTVAPAARPAATQLLSHLGGDPYFEAGEAWPVNPNTGQPLELIFQLVDEGGRLNWPFPAAVVQFYLDQYGEEGVYDDSDPAQYRFQVYPAIRPGQQALVPRPAALPAIGCYSITAQPRQSLPDDDELELISPATKALCRQLAGEKWRKVYNAAVAAVLGEAPDLGSWVGGYAQWLQGAYPTGEFLLQFDSNEAFMWGDSGLLYFCYDPADPAAVSFQLQSC
ncbi:DUF1963 domain-containing protein [Hymenobacter gummosus]|uniref:DUF1963 domain-containing protein n=1 Tax=Hymenobacter gummosus TaxID=1776032 RepID=A0A3S0QEJ4_9BACT|nr:DUF1963 domain-containing protein [Hymenobacter gummosus]RTQ45607.1 DUF1963 domain-containing protein [Hymenobacter gummosus]